MPGVGTEEKQKIRCKDIFYPTPDMDKKFFTQPLLIFPDNHKKKSAEIIPELFQRRKVQLFDSQMES
jgi:hypothetical protein